MTTSGSTNYTATGLDVITEALSIIGVYSPGEEISATESEDAMRTLNMMMKSWQVRYGLWLQRELSLFMQTNTVAYNIGPTGTHCAENAVKTEVATAAASGASSVVIDATTWITDSFDRNGIVTATTPAAAGALTLNGALVTSGIATMTSDRYVLVYSDADDSGVTFTITGKNGAGVAVTEVLTGPDTTTVYSANTYKTITSIAISAAGTGSIEIGQVGDHIGIELDSGSLQWTYINAALSTTITLGDALTGAVAVDNHVYSYKEKTARPTEIVESRRVLSDGTDVQLIIGGRHDYMLLSDKTTESVVNQIWYDKQLTNGVMRVWPEPSDVQEYIKFTAKLLIQDIDSLTDNFEVSVEWLLAVSWNLAVLLSPKYGKQLDQMVMLKAAELLDYAQRDDSENVANQIQIELR